MNRRDLTVYNIYMYDEGVAKCTTISYFRFVAIQKQFNIFDIMLSKYFIR